MVLENKLNITNQIELNKVEERLSKEKAIKLFDSGKINTLKVGTFAGLKIFMILPEKCVMSTYPKVISDLRR